MSDVQDGQQSSKRTDPLYGEGVPRNGVDFQAAQRAHMRELTTARQEAERRHASSRSLEGRLDPRARHAAAAKRLADYQAELARIEDKHQQWLRQHNLDLPARPWKSRGKLAATSTETAGAAEAVGEQQP